jgi:hypothetical protein
MSSKKRARTKGRDGIGRFVAIPHAVLVHPDFQKLTGSAVKVLLVMLTQYNGHNNGDFTLALSVMKGFGFSSSDTINSAKKQLLKHGLIIETRPGQFTNPGGICALYAVTWQPIDDCQGKLNVAPTSTPPRKFSLENQQRPSLKITSSGNRSESIRKPD